MINYKRSIPQDPAIVDLEMDENELAVFALKTTTGAPSTVTLRKLFEKGAQIMNIFDGAWYENTGTVASPVWSLVPSTGSGITTLTGDVTAGPGTGSQVAQVEGLFSVPLTAAATIDASFYVFDSTPGEFNPVVMSGNVTMTNAGVTTVTGATGNFAFGGKITSNHTASTGAGAVAVTASLHEITTTGTGDALTLADGVAGQRLTVIYVAEGAGSDTAILTPTTLAGGNTITFSTLGQTAQLVYSATGGWYMVGGSAVIA